MNQRIDQIRKACPKLKVGKNENTIIKNVNRVGS